MPKHMLHSYLDYNDFEALTRLVQKASCPEMNVLEVGVGEGGTTTCLLGMVMDLGGHIWGVDLWPDKEVWKKFVEATWSHMANGSLYLFRISSERAMKMFANEVFGLIFIDADHRYSYVKQDIIGWLPKVKEGGILCGHDCEKKYTQYSKDKQQEIDKHAEDEKTSFDCHPGVVKALYDVFNDDYKRYPKSRIWYKVRDA